MLRYQRSVFVLLALFVFNYSYAQDIQVIVDAPGPGGHNTIKFIESDALGNLYVYGHHKTMTIGSCNANATNWFEQFVAKVDTNGNCIWLETIDMGTIGPTNAKGMGIDSNGNVYITGVFQDSVTIQGTTLVSPDLAVFGIFMAKFDAAGTLQYFIQEGTVDNLQSADIAVMPDGTTYLSGSGNDTINIAGSQLIPVPGLSSGFVAKYDANGNGLWAAGGLGVYTEKLTFFPNGDPVVTFTNNGLAVVPSCAVELTNGSQQKIAGIASLDAATGACNWATYLNPTTYVFLTDVAVAPSGNVAYVAHWSNAASACSVGGTCTAGATTQGYGYGTLVGMLDPSGNCLWISDPNESPTTNGISPASLEFDATSIYLSGSYTSSTLSMGNSSIQNNGNSDIFVARFSSTGEPIALLGAGGFHDDNLEGATMANGTLYFAGNARDPSQIGSGTVFNTLWASYVAKVSAATINPLTATITGTVGIDLDNNCTLSGSDSLANGWKVHTQPYGYWDFVDSTGNFSIAVPTGTFTLVATPIGAAPGLVDSICLAPNSPVILANDGDTAVVDVLAHIDSCNALTVDIASNTNRPCFANRTSVQYTNPGIVAVQNASVVVTLDPTSIPISSSPPWTTQNNNVLTYQLGTVQPGASNTILITDSIDCAYLTNLGQALCASAVITPVYDCGSVGSWDQSDLTLEAMCPPATSFGAHFVLRNEGSGNMATATDLSIFVDSALVAISSAQLPAGDSLELLFPASPHVIHLEVDQSPNHPQWDYTSASYEGCGPGSAAGIPYGIVNQFKKDEDRPSVAVWTGEIVGSFDPNDKQGQPIGFTANHYIDSTQALDYQIRFQNTGTDTAFTIVIRDTLSAAVDPTSIVAGASSHAYTWELAGDTNVTVLVFSFNNINLLDSNANEPESHGFVQFQIGQLAGNAQGTNIQNHVAIYFDFNPPIFTNTAEHVVFDYTPPTATNPLVMAIGDSLVIDAGADASICQGDSVVIGSTQLLPSGATLLWTGGPAAEPDSLTTLVYPDSTTTYILTVTLGTRIGHDTVLVAVSGSALGDAGPDQAICIGDSVTITATGTGTITWQPDANISDVNLATQSFAPTTTAYYKITATAAGCAAEDSVLVTVNALPMVDAGNSAATCQGDSIQLLATGATFYAWNNATILNDAASANPTAVPTASTLVTVTGTDTNGCAAADSVQLIVNALPLVDAGDSAATCPGDSIQLLAEGATSYVWNNASILTDAAAANPIALPTASTLLSVLGTDTNGCVAEDSVQLIVNALPLVDAGDSTTACMGDSIQLLAIGATSYAWNNATILNDSAVANPIALPVTSTLFTVTGTDTNGCASTAAVWVAVNPAPAVTASSDFDLCENQPFELFATGGTNYSWSPANLLNSTTSDTVAGTLTATTTFAVTVTDANACTASASVTGTMLPAPTPAITAATQQVCSNDSIQLQATGGASFVWSGQADFSDINAANPWVHLTSDQTIVVQVTAANGCLAEDSIALQSLDAPVVFATGDTSICTGDSVPVVAATTLSVQWSPAAGLANPLATSTTASPTTSTTYSAQVSAANGCTGSASVSIVVLPAPPQPTLAQSGSFLIANPPAQYEWHLNDTLISGADGDSIALTSNGTYTVRVVDANGCDAWSEEVTVVDVGLHEAIGKSAISVFPNPASRRLWIAWPVESSTMWYQLYSSNGALARQGNATGKHGRTSVSLDGLTAGIYLLQVRTNNSENTTVRVVVE